MRIVEPKRYDINQPEEPKKVAKRTRKPVVFGLLAIFVVFGAFLLLRDSDTPDTVNAQTTESSETDDSTQLATQLPPDQATPDKYRVFSGNEFRIFYDNLLQPNLDRVDVPPVISGNEVADTIIRQIAEARGYKLRSSPSVSLNSVQGYLVQEPVVQAWIDLQSVAASEGLQMSIVSAFRSVDTQRSLFLSRLAAQGVSINDVANGVADEAVNEVLVTSSIPGYSKHHTGYTIDIACAGFAFESFGQSPCFAWLSENNYEQAKKYGFIPSYPEDADMQGPDPEAWEYVYVGADLLRN